MGKRGPWAKPALRLRLAVTRERSMIRISAFADEISQDPVEQIDVLTRHGIRRSSSAPSTARTSSTCPTRSTPSSARCSMPADSRSARSARRSARSGSPSRSTSTSSGSSGPWTWPTSTRRRGSAIFSFYIPPGDDPAAHRDEVIRRMAELAALRGRHGGSPCSSRTRRGSTATPPPASPTSSRRVDSPGLSHAFDPANYVEVRPADRRGLGLAPATRHPLPRQGLRREAREQRPGRRGRRPDPPPDRRRPSTRGYDGFCVLEPHLVVAGLSSGFTGPERFADAVARPQGHPRRARKSPTSERRVAACRPDAYLIQRERDRDPNLTRR